MSIFSNLGFTRLSKRSFLHLAICASFIVTVLALHSFIVSPYLSNADDEVPSSTMHPSRLMLNQPGSLEAESSTSLFSRNSYKRKSCRSVSWGPVWTVDSNGGVCKHRDPKIQGCCGSYYQSVFVKAQPVSSPSVPNSDPQIDAAKTNLNMHPSDSNINSEKEREKATTPDKDENEQLEKSLPPSFPSPPSPLYITHCPSCSSEHNCCSQYEFCVSCCMDYTWRHHASKLSISRHDSNQPSSNNDKSIDNSNEDNFQIDKSLLGYLLTPKQQSDPSIMAEYEAASNDLFDWCILRCRTSSKSVVHQNAFRSSLKYCYGPKDAPLLAHKSQAGDSTS